MQAQAPSNKSKHVAGNSLATICQNIGISQEQKKLEQLIRDQAIKKRKKKTDEKLRPYINQAGNMFHPIIQLKSVPPPKTLIGELFRINPQKNSSDIFLGTTFFVSQDTVIASFHQFPIEKDCQMFVMLPSVSQFSQEKFKVNLYDKHLCREYEYNHQIKYDYAFLRVQVSQNVKAYIRQNLQKFVLAQVDKFESQKDFSFKAIICGFIKYCPLEMRSSQYNQDYEGCLHKSESQAFYNGKYLQYGASTTDGMSGSPIIIQAGGIYVIIGMHIKGNYYQQKNYGLIFNNKIYQQLQTFILKTTPTKPSQKDILNKLLIKNSLKDYFQKLSQKPFQIQLEKTGIILKSLINKIYHFYKHSIFPYQLNEDKILVQIISKQNPGKVQFKKIALQYNHLQMKNDSSRDQIFILLKKIILGNEYISNIFSILAFKQKDKKPQEGELKNKQKYLPFMLRSLIQQKVDNITQLYYLSQQAAQIFLQQKSPEPSNTKDYTTITNQQQNDKQTNFFSMSQYKFQHKQERIQSFHLLLKYSINPLTKLSFLRIYMVRIMEIHANIRNRLNTALQIIKDKAKLDPDIKYVSLGLSFQSLLNKMNLHQTLPKKDDDFYKKLKTQKQNYKSLLGSLHGNKIINQLIYYQYIFVQNLYDNWLKPIIDNIETQSKRIEKKLLQMYDKKTLDTQLKFKLHQRQDNFPQNRNKFKAIYSNNKIHYKQFQILSQIFIKNQLNSYAYRLTNLTLDDYDKYKKQLDLLVQIRKDGYTKATGFMISSDLVCTALHAFGQGIDNYETLDQQAKKFTVLSRKGQHQIIGIHPNPIKIENQQFDDIAIVKINISNQNQNNEKVGFSILDFPVDKIVSNLQEKQFALIIGFGKSNKSDSNIVYKKCIGQLVINDDIIPHKHYIPLKAEPILSGSPIIIWAGTQNKQLPLALGVYLGKVQHYKQLFGRYSKFNSQKKFPSLKNQISPRPIKEYQTFFNERLFIEYINEHYGNLDHLLLRVIAQILKLNHYNFYIKQLKVNNLILNREDDLNIIFSGLQLYTFQQVYKQFEKLFVDTDQRRQVINKVIEKCEQKNFITFKNFLRQIDKIYQNKQKQSLLLKQILNMPFDYSSLNEFIKYMDQNYIIKERKRKQRIYPDFYLQPVNEKKNKSQKKLDYYDIYERHFKLKPLQRIKKILTLTHLIKYPQKKAIDILYDNKFKLVNIKRFFRSRLKILNEVFSSNNNNKQMSHFHFLKDYFKQSNNFFIQYQVPYGKMKQDSKQFENFLKSRTQIIYDSKYKAEIQYKQLVSFTQQYEMISRWKNLQDYLQYNFCLRQLQRTNMKIKIEKEDDQTQFDIYDAPRK